MICVSLSEAKLTPLLGALRGLEFAEVRLERLLPNEAALRMIFGGEGRRIATMRAGTAPNEVRKRILIGALEAGAAFVDLDLQTDKEIWGAVLDAARGEERTVIGSFHDFEGTPPFARLRQTANEAFAMGAGVAKVACFVEAPADAARLLGLLEDGRPIVPLGMGPLGRITRVAATLLGSPFTYASAALGKETAPGQIPTEELARLIEEV